MDTVTTDTTTPDKAVTVDVPADRVPEFYAWYARFLAGESFRGRRRGRHGGHRHGPHGHRHCGPGGRHEGHGHEEHGRPGFRREHPFDDGPEPDTTAGPQQRSAPADA